MPLAAKVFNRTKRRKRSGGATKAGIGKADLSCPLTMGVFFIFLRKGNKVNLYKELVAVVKLSNE
jgi:hypothetical protein